MILLRTAPQFLASLGFALAIAVSPCVLSGRSGVTCAEALAKEAAAGGKKEAGDDEGRPQGCREGRRARQRGRARG